MESIRMTLPIDMNFEKIEELNPEFSRYKCRVMAIGKNRNGSYFSREVVENTMSQFQFCPVVGYMYRGEDGKNHMAGHEMVIEESNGSYRWKSLCVPYGVVPYDDFSFEDVVDNNGNTSTYLTCSVILWTGKYPELLDASYSNDVLFGQSMEINVTDWETYAEDDNYINILKFTPSALCLLGKNDDPEYNVEPCFKNAAILPYSFDDRFGALMDEFKFALSQCVKNIGGAEMEENKELDVSPNSEDCNSEIENTYSTEEENHDDEMHVDDIQDDVKSFSNLESSKRSKLANAVMELRNQIDGYAYLIDFDEEYVYIEWEIHNKYTRHAYVYDEFGNTSIAPEGENVALRWLTQNEVSEIESLRNSIEDYESRIYELEVTNAELTKFRDERIAQDHAAEIETVFSEFADLDDNDEFIHFKGNVGDMDIETIREKCFAIRGKNFKPVSAAKKDAKTPIVNNPDCNLEPYGGLFAKYGYHGV